MSRWFATLPPEGAARLTAQHLCNSLQNRLGEARFKTFDTARYLTAFRNLLRSPEDSMVVDLMNQSLAVQCLDFGSTHVLITALSPLTLFTLNLLRRQSITTVHWFYEDYRRTSCWRDLLPGCDWVPAIQRGAIEEACRERGVKFVFLPTAVARGNTEATPPPLGSAEYDVGFVGIPSSYRVRVLEKLASAGITIRIAGHGWSSYRGHLRPCIATDRWVEGADASAVLESARVGINLSVKSPAEVDPSDIHISPRVFEVLAAGRVLLTEDVPLAEEVLRGYHYYTFHDPDHAPRQVRDLLDRTGSLQHAARADRARVLSRDTYDNRVEQILRLVESDQSR